MSRLWLTVPAVALILLPASVLADDAKELKIIATAKESNTEWYLGPIQLRKTTPFVIRNTEELVAASKKPKSAKEADVQKEMESALAKLLKVDAIDWKKQMVIAGVIEKFESVKSDGKVLTVTYARYVERPTRAVLPWPKVISVVDRFEGEVRFVAIEKKDEPKK